jgi:hypothetical protein
MTAPDPAYVRAYKNDQARHRDNAHRAFVLAKQHLETLLARWDDEPSASLAYDARQLCALAAEGWAKTEAFLALHDVRFLTTDPDTEG